MASPPASLPLHGSLPPFLRHMRGFPPRPPPWCHQTQAIRQPPDGRQILEKFRYTCQVGHGWLEIRHMKDEELDAVALLLAESSNRTQQLPDPNIRVSAFVAKQYIVERRRLIPDVAILVGFYKEKDGEEAQLACTAEISFNARGAYAAVGTPRPPKDCPYISNVTVRRTLRRVADTGPLRLYTSAGYKVVKKDRILIWLAFKRRRYLMLKELSPTEDDNQSDVSGCS